MTARISPVDAVNGAPTYSGRAWRQTAVAPFVGGATSARPLGARSGVRPGGAPSVTVTSSTVVTVGPFAGVVDGETANEAGPYGVAFDAATAVGVAAANGSNPRVDLISVQVSDPAESDGSTVPGVALVYTQGAASPSPSQPSTPARSFPLVRVNVPASGGGNPTASFVGPYMVAAGGNLPVDTWANLNLQTGWPGAHATVYADATAANNGGYNWSLSSGAWVSSSTDSGWVNASLVNSFVTGSATVQFRKIGNRVSFRGDVGRAGVPNIRATAFTLPAGFVPTTLIIQPVGVSAWACDVQIDTSGNVGVQASTQRSGGSVGYPFGALTFLVD